LLSHLAPSSSGALVGNIMDSSTSGISMGSNSFARQRSMLSLSLTLFLLVCLVQYKVVPAFLITPKLVQPIFGLTSIARSKQYVIMSATRSEADTDAAVAEAESLAARQPSGSMQFVNGMQEVAKDYDVFLLDMWGVMHDGSKPYKGVIDCVRQLKKQGKRLVILSNSSKRIDHSKKMLTKLGFDPLQDFDDIITSGEVSFRLLSGDPTLSGVCSWPPLDKLLNSATATPNNKKVLVLGSGDNDAEYIESAGWELASSVEDATLLVARGTFTVVQKDRPIITKNKHDEQEYNTALSEILQEAAKRQIPMLVCNPDKVRPDEGLPPMPGAIGDAYVKELVKHQNQQTMMSQRDAEALVKRIGKPYREVYDLALQNSPPSTRACMVGDALETDITGGIAMSLDNNNCDTVWVIQDGIHGPTVREGEQKQKDGKHISYEAAVSTVLNDFNSASSDTGISRMGQEDGSIKIQPTFVIPHFRW
jgi:HAD superfamily hydrolase (TIGR01459 family)